MKTKETMKNHHIYIDIQKPHELWDWADKLKVSAAKLKQAVLKVGSSLRSVEAYLKK